MAAPDLELPRLAVAAPGLLAQEARPPAQQPGLRAQGRTAEPLAGAATRPPLSDRERRRFEQYLGEVLGRLGLDFATPATTDTPHRFLQALVDATDGYEGDPKLVTTFPTECHGGSACELDQVVEGPIPFSALCEHHALPFIGESYVGYVAHEEILGISKLTRLVRVVTHRFGVQERMTEQIADELTRIVSPHGVAVRLVAHHACTQIRGVREMSARTRTTAYRGVYVRDAALRREFLELSDVGRGAS